MSALSLTKPVIGQPNSTEDVKIPNAFTAIETWGNGNIGASNLDSTTNAQLGSNDGTTVRRGKSIIAASEGRTNVAYGLLGTPDRVQNVVLTTDGLINIAYQARWQNSASSSGKAAIFIGANQLQILQTTSPSVQEATGATTLNVDCPLASFTGGLASSGSTGGTADVTTGQIIATNTTFAGYTTVFAAAGTYDVSVQFKSASGSVTVNTRKLWVWTVGF